MKIQVIFYGGLKQDVGTKQQTFEFPGDGLTVGRLVEALKVQYPALAVRLDTIAYAVNDEIVELNTVLRDGDQAGLLPPVSGG